MPCPSSTTSDEELAHNPHRPRGLRRHWSGLIVPAPRRWGSINFVAAPRNRRPVGGRWSRQAPHPKDAAWAGIQTNGVRNWQYRGFSAGPLAARCHFGYNARRVARDPGGSVISDPLRFTFRTHVHTGGSLERQPRESLDHRIRSGWINCRFVLSPGRSRTGRH